MKRRTPGIGLPSDALLSIKPKKTFSSKIKVSPAKVFSSHKDHEPISKTSTSEVFFCSFSPKTPQEKALLGSAYDEPKKYEEQQLSNAHLNAEFAILNRLRRLIWPFNQEKLMKSRSYQIWQDDEHQHSEDKVQSIVSLGCGSGWLDRRLIDMLSYDLKRAHGKLRLLGIDTHPDNIERARTKMKKMLASHKLEHFVKAQYLLANLEGPTSIPVNGAVIDVPGLCSINLKKTVIRADFPDLFLAFYLFHWTQDKDAAIQAIAEKSRGAMLVQKNSIRQFIKPTRFISGEEFPLHITPNPYMTEDFKNGVRNYAKPIDIEELWAKFAASGFEMILGTDGTEPLKSSDEHWIHYRAMEFKGQSK